MEDYEKGVRVPPIPLASMQVIMRVDASAAAVGWTHGPDERRE
jgi:hypothetical protein